MEVLKRKSGRKLGTKNPPKDPTKPRDISRLMTYEDIAKETELSAQHVHKILKETHNKVIVGLMEKHSVCATKAVLMWVEYTGEDPLKIYRYLDPWVKSQLKYEAENYETQQPLHYLEETLERSL